MPAIDRETLDAVIMRLIELGLVGQEEESSTQTVSSATASSLEESSQSESRIEPEAHTDLDDRGANVSGDDSDQSTVKICACCLQTMADHESFNIPLTSLSQLAAVVAPPPVATPAPVQPIQVTLSGPAPSVPAPSAAPIVLASAAPGHASTVAAPPDALSNITPAGRIPQFALRFMTAATIDALNALDLDTVPPNPNDGWYTITVGTWIGISDDWSFVSFHVSGVSRAAYRREDSWMDARTRFLRARDQGICRLV